MTATPKTGRRHLAVPLMVTIAVLLTLLALGFWQLERKHWKETLIATLHQRLSQLPVPLPAPAEWPRLDRQSAEFQRVSFTAQFPGDEALVYTPGSRLSGIAGAGYWVLSPARLANGGTVVVSRGFVPDGQQSKAPERALTGPLTGTGVLRWPEERSIFMPADNPAKNLFYTRDPEAIAAAKNWGPVAPFYVELQSPAPVLGQPRIGRLDPQLPNNHLQYALTWFGLAVGLVIVFLVYARGRSRPEV